MKKALILGLALALTACKPQKEQTITQTLENKVLENKTSKIEATKTSDPVIEKAYEIVTESLEKDEEIEKKELEKPYVKTPKIKEIPRELEPTWWQDMHDALEPLWGIEQRKVDYVNGVSVNRTVYGMLAEYGWSVEGMSRFKYTESMRILKDETAEEAIDLLRFVEGNIYERELEITEDKDFSRDVARSYTKEAIEFFEDYISK